MNLSEIKNTYEKRLQEFKNAKKEELFKFFEALYKLSEDKIEEVPDEVNLGIIDDAVYQGFKPKYTVHFLENLNTTDKWGTDLTVSDFPKIKGLKKVKLTFDLTESTVEFVLDLSPEGFKPWQSAAEMLEDLFKNDTLEIITDEISTPNSVVGTFVPWIFLAPENGLDDLGNFDDLF